MTIDSPDVSTEPEHPSTRPSGVRLRRVLVAVIVILALIPAVAAVARQCSSALDPMPEPDAPAPQATVTPSWFEPKWWDAPDVVSLLGLSTWDAIEAIGHGAAVRDDNVGYSAQTPDGMKRVTVAMAGERSKDDQEAPTVVLWTKGGRVVQAVYSSSMRSYGFSNMLTFRQAIDEAHVVEHALLESGARVPRTELALPEDENAYTSYRDDRRTVEREHADFEGEVPDADVPYAWMASLDYDYTESIDKSSLSYTHRVLSVGARIL